MKFKRTLLATAVMMATATQAMGEETVKTGKASMLDQVTVTATRTEKQLKDVAASVTVIDSEQIEKEMARNIKDMLRYEPGVQVGSEGRAGIKDINIRGLGGNRVKIMVDGISQPQSFDSGYTYLESQRNFIDIDTLKAVEIVKGPSSSLYGSDAMGGIVAFTTKDPADYLKPEGDDTYGSIKGGYTSADEGLTETLTLANRTGDLETMLVYTRRDYKETETHGGANITGEARGQANPLDAGSDNLLAKAQYQLNDDHRIGVTGEFLQSQTDYKLMSDKYLPSTTKGDDKKKRSRLSFTHEWDADLAAFDNLKWHLDWQDSTTDQKTTIPAYGSYNDRIKKYDYSETSYQLGAQLDKTLELSGLTHHIIYGFDVVDTEFTNDQTTLDLGNNSSSKENIIPKVDSLTYGIFAQNDIQVTDRLSITPGIRYDHYEYKPKSNSGYTTEQKDTKEGKLTGRLGAVYKLTENLSTFAQYSQGFKAPDLIDMYQTMDNPAHGYKQLANPDLKPETSDAFELGLRGNNHLGSFEIAAFYNKYKDFIDTVYLPTAPGYWQITQEQNISEARIKGVEIKGQLWLDEAINAPMGTSLKASVAYADGEGKQDNAKSEPLNSVAPLKGVFGLAYDDPSELWGSELTWTLVKSKSSSDVSNNEVSSGNEQYVPSGYGIVDLTAYYKPHQDITLRAGLFNLTDKKYMEWDNARGRDTTYVGFDRLTQPGRNVAVSAKWEF
ncbi:TonB-dependent hemoglobin/transferrin/lactoferrin family receptor [Kistimonas asteriae]|uniref:TonB-dependent hemoglobin/transferrin/lactoferrin family receptor n=1 Tax=Kistimonas asteriae TaxID=517724 RepID=UPI001BA6A6AE|nr:TonB-dependent hemoglobin/transferrin/lactoferrin family receptor [Kistimonas asteriae]